jgi:hypothetical protein
MDLTFEQLLAGLAARDIDFIVVGGVAVVLHGYPRMTADIDLFVQLEEQNLLAFFGFLGDIGFEPRLPVEPADFADETCRQKWIENKGMKVFSMYYPTSPGFLVDIFAEEPMPYAEMKSKAASVTMMGETVWVVSIDDLIEMKRSANRRKDKQDVEQLERIKQKRPGN